MDLLPLPPTRRPVPLLARLLVQCAVLFALLCLFAEAVAYAQPTPAPNAPPLQDIVSLISAHGWLPLFALGLLYARKLCGPDSKFPITIPPTWLPSVSAFFGLAYGVVSSLVNGSALGPALLLCAVAAGGSGFFDGLLTAIFNHGAAPRWAQALVFLFDDLTGGGTNSTAAGKNVKAAAAAPAASVAGKAGAALSALLLVLGLGGTLGTQSACTPQQGTKVVNGLPADATFIACVWNTYQAEPAGTPALQVLDDEVKACGGDGAAAVTVLDQKEPRALHASVAHAAAK